ncbi:MAG TPA: kelch repeat-containing protein, partial [Gemmatimonadota bacterium]|nr:kelch repeat-containing protein [Gemmatimonadota bacterium]
MTPAILYRVGGLGALFVVCQPASPTTGGASAQVATLHEARAAHTATTLPSGQVLVVGGMEDGGGGLASVELFDPDDNSVHELGSLFERRVSHTATLLA